MNFIMTMGVPGSGKSYTANKYKDNHLILSSDEIRAELNLGQEDKDHKIVFAELHNRLQKAMKNNQDVVYDATNLSSRRRRHILSEIKKYNPNTEILVHVTDKDLCHKRNESRDRIVPRGVINEMIKNFEFPFYHEGWNKIDIITRSEKKYDLENDYKQGLYHIPQDNPHHTLFLDDHMTKVYDILNDLTDNRLLILSAKFHDIGKLYTKTFKDSKGRPSEYAHFYRHENVSSYLTALYLADTSYTLDKKIEMCFYVQKHMFKTEDMKPFTKQKYKDWYGEDRFNNLLLFHKADGLAK